MTNKENIEKWGNVKLKKITEFSFLFTKEFEAWENTKKFDVLIDTREKDDITVNQENELRNFFASSRNFFDKSKDEIIKYVLLDRENGNYQVPQTIPEKIESYASPKSISITADSEKNPTSLCLLFDYKYDAEGICVMFRKGEIIQVGSQDILVC